MDGLDDFDDDDIDSVADDSGSDDSNLVDTMQVLHDIAAQVKGVYCSHSNLPDDEW